MKFILALIPILLFHTYVYGQDYIIINKSFKAAITRTSTLAEEDYKKSNFIIRSSDVDTIVSSLTHYLPYLETIGRAGFISDELQAGDTKIKITSKPLSQGDTYSIEANTKIRNKVSRIIFGIAGQKNRYTAINIKRFINLLKPKTYHDYPFSYPVL
jgi:hypothetical protein